MTMLISYIVCIIPCGFTKDIMLRSKVCNYLVLQATAYLWQADRTTIILSSRFFCVGFQDFFVFFFSHRPLFLHQILVYVASTSHFCPFAVHELF